MKAKILKTEAEYEAALAHVEGLMDAALGSPEEDELELFSVLIEQYEKEHYPIEPPDPVDAILFRMEQQGLTRKDLEIYIGSQSKISEVLNRKRPLSLAMIRRLHTGLGIPADILLHEPGRKLEPPRFSADDFPIYEMRRCGYFGAWSGTPQATKEHAEDLLTSLFVVFEGVAPQPVYYRQAESENGVNENALSAWQARVLTLAQLESIPSYVPQHLDEVFFNKLVRASYFPSGPTLVKELLNEKGIHFVILPHLSQTYLDGAAFLSPQGHPVIGMTLRHDRLDNFWFTLAHEIGHICLHLEDRTIAFFDDTEHPSGEQDPRESQADTFARRLLIPDDVWQQVAPAMLTGADDEAVRALAAELEISPAIIAGRIRWESGDYTRHTKLIGHGKLRALFKTEQTQRQPSD